MASDLEKAEVMFKLARKNNWGACYDRTEHFKRFPNLDEILSELSRINWAIIHKKGKFTGVSLNTEYKREIIALIEQEMPELTGMIR